MSYHSRRHVGQSDRAKYPKPKSDQGREMTHPPLPEQFVQEDCPHRAECLALLVKDALKKVAAQTPRNTCEPVNAQVLAAEILDYHTAIPKDAGGLDRRHRCTQCCLLRVVSAPQPVRQSAFHRSI